MIFPDLSPILMSFGGEDEIFSRLNFLPLCNNKILGIMGANPDQHKSVGTDYVLACGEEEGAGL